MASLTSHPRVWNSCLLLLQRKGYRLWCVPDPTDDTLSTVTWFAERAGVELHADNPLELVGLEHLYEQTGADLELAGPDLIGELFLAAFPD